MKAFNNLTKKQKVLGGVGLVLLLLVAFFYNSDFLRPRDRKANAEKVQALQEKENQDLKKITGKKNGKITAFTIGASQESLTPGVQVQFSGEIQGEGDYDQSIAWALVSPHGEKTFINSQGLLTVGPDETVTALTVEASVDKGNFKDQKTLPIAPNPNQVQTNQPVKKPKNKAELKAVAQQEQAKVTPEEQAKRQAEERRVKQEAIAKTSGGKKDQYLTDPTPAGKPKPVEPGSVKKEDKVETCTISIHCTTILDNMDRFNMDKIDVLPVDGVILPKKTVEFHPGESVFDILNRETKASKIHMESSFTPAYNSAYVMGIHNLYEFDCGELSGWMYKVNGWFPNYGCSRYEIKPGDSIEWVYTCDLGRDVGDNSMVK